MAADDPKQPLTNVAYRYGEISMALRQFVPCLFVVVACSDSTPRNLDTLIQEADIYLDSETMKPYSGPVARFAPHDQTVIEMKGELVDGRLNGWVEKFATVSGTITSRVSYRNGEQQGPYESYYMSGELWEKGSISNGLPNGPSELYHENGELAAKGSYLNGELDGPYESYHENGKPDVKSFRLNGKLDGPYERLTDFGDIFERGIYHNGEQCGEWIVQANISNYDTTAYTYPPCPNDG